MTFNLKDKVAIITGAAGGIGSMVVKNLLKENIKHVAILDVAETAGIALQDELNAEYDNKVKFYKCDVTSEEQFITVLKDVREKHGFIDVLINNAGIFNDSWAKYKIEIEVNFTALVTGTLRGLELMRQDQGGKGGVIINISSVAAITQAPYLPIYSATKSAVLQFSNCIGMDDWYSRTGVRVIAICFGATDTPLLSLENVGSFDEGIAVKTGEILKINPVQTAESAAVGVIEVLKKGISGSTWLVNANKPAEDISSYITKPFDIV